MGYGAPMEDVARRARVGVGTVYRRFPSKDVLVQRIAEEETARLTEQARAALDAEEQPWRALSRFLRTSVDSGAGRLLPPRILRAGSVRSAALPDGTGDATPGGEPEPVAGVPTHWDGRRLPHQRHASSESQPELRLVGRQRSTEGDGLGHGGLAPGALASEVVSAEAGEPGAEALLEVVGQLVDRARAAGELRPDVTVGDVLLVIATAAPSLPDAAQQSAASARLLDILLAGLRSQVDA